MFVLNSNFYEQHDDHVLKHDLSMIQKSSRLSDDKNVLD